MAKADGAVASITSWSEFAVIPTGVAGIFLRAVVWRAGHGAEGPRQHVSPTTITVIYRDSWISSPLNSAFSASLR